MDIEKLVASIRPAYEQLKVAVLCNDLICITGPPATGKTTLAKMVFEENPELVAAHINCYDLAYPTQLYTKICSCFHASMNICKKDKSGRLTSTYRCDQTVNEPDFPNYFEEYHQYAKRKGYKHLFVVIDQIELLTLGSKSSVMNSVALLLTISNMKLIFITNKSPTDVVRYIANVSERLGLRCQDRIVSILVTHWSRSDIIDRINQWPPKEGAHLYRTFVTNVVNLLYSDRTRNYRELQLYCQEEYEEFLESYKAKLKECQNSSYEDDESLDEDALGHREILKLTSTSLKSLSGLLRKRDISEWNSSTTGRVHVNATVLMIALYCAAHSSPADDKRYFVRLQRKKSSRGGQRAASNANQEQPSRSFTLERLIHIYRALMRRRLGKNDLSLTEYNDYVLAEIDRLETLDILQPHGGDGYNSETRYRLSSCIKLKYIRRLATNIELSLDQFDWA